jgi:hypothetical protein
MQLPKFKKPTFTSILLYYSVTFSTLLIVGGFYNARTVNELISNLLFLPIVIFLILTLVKYRKKKSVVVIKKNKIN